MAKDFLIEDVPSFSRRVDDRTIEGSNNSLILLSRDRSSIKDSGNCDEKGSGMIHAVVGRKSKNLNMSDDSAFITISMNNNPDDNLEITVGDNKQNVSSYVAKADSVRVVAREDVKIISGNSYAILNSDGSITIEGDIRLGKNAVKSLLTEDFIQNHLQHTHVSPSTGGPTGPPVQPIVNNLVTTAKVKAE